MEDQTSYHISLSQSLIQGKTLTVFSFLRRHTERERERERWIISADGEAVASYLEDQ
jgi:hypothetical protein